MKDKKKIKEIQKIVWAHYEKYGRHNLPWRKTRNPYRVLVSEIMLQQTQVARVIPKYKAFLKQFPTLESLSKAPLRDVLIAWQGLGYNRRAKALHALAELVVTAHKGRMPTMFEELIRLPGIGPYTAGAVCAFAYNTPVPILETNIRTILFHHFFTDREQVHDAELMSIVEILLDKQRPREWYWALMDYGAYLKEQGVRSNAKSKHYTPQSTFKGSDREVRGAIIRTLSLKSFANEKDLISLTKIASTRIHRQLLKLEKEGMVTQKNKVWFLP